MNGNACDDGGVRIGELGDRLGVNPKTIRYYESIGVLPQPERTASGYRVYDESDVDRITFVKAAQRLGITLDEVREIVALRERDQPPCRYVREILAREVAGIDQRIAELQRLRDELVGLEAVADRLPASEGEICRLIDHVRRGAAGPAGD